MRKVLYIDVEWANSQNKSICQIGLISEDLDTGETILPELNLYVNPEDNYDDNCIAVHHITNEKTKNCKTFKDLWCSSFSCWLYLISVERCLQISFAFCTSHHFHDIDYFFQISQVCLVSFYFWAIDTLQRFESAWSVQCHPFPAS